MPGIRSLKTLVSKARTLREHHEERHRPTGFGFALADRVDYLDAARWDAVTKEHSVFFSRRYLRVLEESGPDNVRQRYALIFRGREPVAAVAAQAVTISVTRARKKTSHKALSKTLEWIDETLLICGNLLSWGPHGVAFVPHQDRGAVWSAVAEALYRLRRADKLSGQSDLVVVKDLTPAYAVDAAGPLKRFSYRRLETEPNMVLDISPKWKTYDDYLASLTSKYRKTAKEIDKDVIAAGCRVEKLNGPDDVAKQANALHGLYLQTHNNARVRPVTLPLSFLPALAENLGSDMRWSVLKRDDQILGFVNTVRDGETAIGYYIGFDRPSNAEIPIYFRLLLTVVEDAISLGCRRLSLGRTALEPKARLGARPESLELWIRHRIPMLNIVVGGLLHTMSHHDDAPERNPFK